jgi:hypothetical protein
MKMYLLCLGVRSLGVCTKGKKEKIEISSLSASGSQGEEKAQTKRKEIDARSSAEDMRVKSGGCQQLQALDAQEVSSARLRG